MLYCYISRKFRLILYKDLIIYRDNKLMKGNILFTFNIFFLKWREKVEQQKHTYEIKQNIWRLWFYIYYIYIYIFFIHQFIIFIKTYSSIQNLSEYCFCLWMHCFWSMWTQHYKLCVHVESVSHRRKDNHNILNKFCFISNNTKKTHDCFWQSCDLSRSS